MLCKPQGPGLDFPKVVERQDDKTNKTQINPLSPQRPMERRQKGFWGQVLPHLEPGWARGDGRGWPPPRLTGEPVAQKASLRVL